MKPYPKYKPSGMGWIAELPEHWTTKNLKYVTRFVNGAPFKPSDWKEIGTPIIRIENLNGSEEFNCTVEMLDSKYNVKRGDLLFAWSGNRGTSFGPYVWEKEGLYYLNQHIFRLENYSFDKRWFYWALRALTTHVESQAHGIIGLVHITKEDLGIIPVPYISLSEQQAIATYLDDKTHKIDTLIEKKQRLITLLTEQRTAIISRAVTKGTNPNLKMKDSEIEWIGQIPEHWAVKRLKFVTRINPSGRVSKELTGNLFVPFLPMENLSENGEFDFGELKRLADTQNGFTYFEEGDVIVAKITPCFENGKAGLIKGLKGGFAFGSTEFHVLRANQAHLDNRFLFFVIRSHLFRSMGEALMTGSAGQKRVPTWFVSEYRLALPPLPEQLAITKHLDNVTTRINSVMVQYEKEICILREYRTALILGVVTGKVDVRDYVSGKDN